MKSKNVSTLSGSRLTNHAGNESAKILCKGLFKDSQVKRKIHKYLNNFTLISAGPVHRITLE